MNKKVLLMVTLALGLFMISLANYYFNPITLSAAQQAPVSKVSQITVPCVVHEFPRGCTTKDGKPGLQMQRCEGNIWTDVGACVPVSLGPSKGECLPGQHSPIICVTNGELVQGYKYCSSNGYWVVPADCGRLKPPPKK